MHFIVFGIQMQKEETLSQKNNKQKIKPTNNSIGQA